MSERRRRSLDEEANERALANLAGHENWGDGGSDTVFPNALVDDDDYSRAESRDENELRRMDKRR